MAVTSIWRVKGRLDQVVRYIGNPEKTDNPEFDVEPGQGLEDVIDCAVNTAKTVRVDDEKAPVLRSFVTGVNCSPSTAREEIIAVKRRFGKEGGTIAYHGYQSFAPGEATPEIAHEIGVKLAQRLWGSRYQMLVATHLDKEDHLHSDDDSARGRPSVRKELREIREEQRRTAEKTPAPGKAPLSHIEPRKKYKTSIKEI